MIDVDQALLRSFMRSLRNANRSHRSIDSYMEAARLLAVFRPGVGLDHMTRDDVEAFMTDQLARLRPTGAAVRFRALRRLYHWMVSEEILAISPMAKMTQPHVPEQPVPILTEPDLVALVWVTSGKGFEQRRDHAILRLFIDTGVRLNEIVGPTLGDVDLDVHDVVHVMGKGSRGRSLPFRSKTGTAIDRYLRERTGQPHARLPNLWIAQKGGTTDSGVAKMVRRRGAEAGVENLHRFRHS